MNDSRNIIVDNIFRIKSMQAKTLKELSELTDIKLPTLKSWSQGKSYPRLKTLDKFCDNLRIHTSDMFEEGTMFKTPYSKANASHKRFLINFINQCNERHLLKEEEILDFLNDEYSITHEGIDFDVISIDALKSYKRKANGRQIPIKKLDYIADRFDIESFMLLR